jgi:hypothetical protein
MNHQPNRRAVMRTGCVGLVSLLLPTTSRSAPTDQTGIEAWRSGVCISPVLKKATCHSIHTYFNTSPESPGGRWVLFYRSTHPEGHRGDVCIVERTTGRVNVLASNVTVEDAHRVACQQWISDGWRVVFHDLRGDEWAVVSVDIDSGKERILATGRQIAWGQPHADLVPLYGPHWAPGEHRDLEAIDVNTGVISTLVTVADLRKAFPDWVHKEFGEAEISLFFPILSPDMQRVLFKVSSPSGGGFRSAQGSTRKGLFCYDFVAKKFVFMQPDWGHPAWHPDSRGVLNIYGRNIVLIHSETDYIESHKSLPPFPGGHPSFSPDGKLFVTDTQLESFGGSKGDWGVVVGDMSSGQYEILHRFDNTQGATSWRRSHPHPVFSHDGRRIYFNASDGDWTRLMVAERPPN